jgi:hypothetical protein
MLILRDGRTISGTFVSGNAGSIVFRDDNGARRQYPFSAIQAIDFASGSSAAYNSGYRYGSGRRYAGRSVRNAHVSSELPAGTDIVVRTNEVIHSDTAGYGQSYSAVIDRDVLDASGVVAIPRGSSAQLVVRELAGGGVTGSPNLALGLQTVTANGRNYIVSTQDVERSNDSGIGVNRRTAAMVGGGAALGTLLGAIAGGGKGAAIGAAAGAAAGGATQVLTRGKTVKVPAETQLTFRLDQPLQLVAQ